MRACVCVCVFIAMFICLLEFIILIPGLDEGVRTAMVVGIAVAVIVVLGVSIVVAIVLYKRRHKGAKTQSKE